MMVPYKSSSLTDFDRLYYHELNSIVLLVMIYLQGIELKIGLDVMKYSMFSDYQIHSTVSVFVSTIPQ